MPTHPKKGTALFDQWLTGWLQNTETAISTANFSIGTDTSYTGHNIATIAFVIQWHCIDIHQDVRVCSAHSSFDGELATLHDAIHYIMSLLEGQILIITDNEAAIKVTTSNSPHLGFISSLHICQMLDSWFQNSNNNLLEL